MRYKISFGLGFGLGYVLGSRAGRERYEQITRSYRSIRENPTVQQAAGMAQAQADRVVGVARQKIQQRLGQGGSGDQQGARVATATRSVDGERSPNGAPTRFGARPTP